MIAQDTIKVKRIQHGEMIIYMRKCAHLILRFTGPTSGNQTINAAKQTADMDT